MKSLSIFKKFHLAFKSTGTLVRLFFVLYGCCPFFLLHSDDDSGFMKITGLICIGALMASINVVIFSYSMSQLNFYRTLPMNHKDITDVIFFNTLITFVFLVAAHSLYLFIAKEMLDMIWTFLCADFVAAALSTVLIPWYMLDKYAFNANEANRDAKNDEKTAKKNTVRVSLTALFGMLVFAAIYCTILMLGYKNPQNFTMLIAFAAAGLVIMTGTIIFARSIKHPFNR